MTTFSQLPVEVIRLVCHRLPLEDTISLLETNMAMDRLVKNTLFRDMKQLKIDWDAKGATLTFSGPALWQPLSIHTTSNFWEDVVQRAVYVKEIFISKTEDAKNYNILDVLCKQSEFRNHLR